MGENQRIEKNSKNGFKNYCGNARKNKSDYDKKHTNRQIDLKVGDKVLPQIPFKHKGKFNDKFEGPYDITEKL